MIETNVKLLENVILKIMGGNDGLIPTLSGQIDHIGDRLDRLDDHQPLQRGIINRYF